MDWINGRLAEGRELWPALACLLLYLIWVKLGQVVQHLKPILFLLQRKHERETGDEIIPRRGSGAPTSWWRKLLD